MRHVFVETNWLHDYAAPAHHKVPEAVRLLERAQQGEFIVHIPNVSFAEARQSIQSKCQPVDGPGIHRYIRWAQRSGELDEAQTTEAYRLADKYVQSINSELSAVPSITRGTRQPSIRQDVCFGRRNAGFGESTSVNKGRAETLRSCHSGGHISFFFQALEPGGARD